MNKLIISTLSVLFSTVFIIPGAIAQEEPQTRTEETLEEVQTDSDMTSETEMEGMEGMEMDPQQESDFELETRTEETLEEVQSRDSSSSYDVRRTEAFNLVSSAYRGDFEDQGINSYAVLVTDYETGELTAEDLVNAAVDAGELSPMALEDTSYIEAVDSQLNALTQS